MGPSGRASTGMTSGSAFASSSVRPPSRDVPRRGEPLQRAATFVVSPITANERCAARADVADRRDPRVHPDAELRPVIRARASADPVPEVIRMAADANGDRPGRAGTAAPLQDRVAGEALDECAFAIDDERNHRAPVGVQLSITSSPTCRRIRPRRSETSAPSRRRAVVVAEAVPALDRAGWTFGGGPAGRPRADAAHGLAISPDGRTIAYVTSDPTVGFCGRV